MPKRLLLLLAASMFPSLATSAAPDFYAIRGGTIHRASGPPIANGTVIIRHGLIEAVGAGIDVPAGATIIDAAGQHVYPGFIDALTTLGLPAPARRRSGDRPQTPPLDPSPSFDVARAVVLTDETVESRRGGGVTTVLSAPSNAIFNGQAALLNLSPAGGERRVVKAPAAMVVAFKPRNSQTFPDSLMGVVAHMRQTLLDAQQLAAAADSYERNPAGRRRPQFNPDLVALRPVIRRELPLIFIAETDLMLQRSIDLAREFNVRAVLGGARQSFKMPEAIRASGSPVLLSTAFPKPPKEAKHDDNLPTRLLRERVEALYAAARLSSAGVPFAFVSNGATADEHLEGIRLAIRAGLPREQALRAATIAPAEILGVARQLGSIDRGKIANLFLSEKEIFDDGAKPRMMWIDGALVRLPSPETKTEAATTSSSVASGDWTLTIRAGDETLSIRVNIQGDATALSGSFSGPSGSGDIREVRLEGSQLVFTLTMQTGPGSETSDWNFEGTITGSSIEGTARTTTGNYTFNGSRPQ